MGNARQWLDKMTAGFLPRRLMVYHQRDVVVLEFTINKAISPEITEPLLSQVVWRKGMAEIAEIHFGERVWEVLDVLRIKIVADHVGETIKVFVMMRTEVADSDENLSRLFGEVIAFSYPTLKYVFKEEKTPAQPSGNKENSIIKVEFRPLADFLPTRRTS